MLTDYTDYLTPYEAADEFGISLTTVYNLLRAKKIPGFKIGKSWRIPKELYRWNETIRKHDSDIYPTTHRGDTLIVVTKKDNGEIVVAYHTDIFEYKN